MPSIFLNPVRSNMLNMLRTSSELKNREMCLWDSTIGGDCYMDALSRGMIN